MKCPESEILRPFPMPQVFWVALGSFVLVTIVSMSGSLKVREYSGKEQLLLARENSWNHESARKADRATYIGAMQNALPSVSGENAFEYPGFTENLFSLGEMRREVMAGPSGSYVVEIPDQSSPKLREAFIALYREEFSRYEAHIARTRSAVHGAPAWVLRDCEMLCDSLARWVYEQSLLEDRVPAPLRGDDSFDLPQRLAQRFGNGSGGITLPRTIIAKNYRESLEFTGLSPLRLVPLYADTAPRDDGKPGLEFDHFAWHFWELVSVVKARDGSLVTWDGERRYQPTTEASLVIHAWLGDYRLLAEPSITPRGQAELFVTFEDRVAIMVNPLRNIIGALAFPYEFGYALNSGEYDSVLPAAFLNDQRGTSKLIYTPLPLTVVDAYFRHRLGQKGYLLPGIELVPMYRDP